MAFITPFVNSQYGGVYSSPKMEARSDEKLSVSPSSSRKSSSASSKGGDRKDSVAQLRREIAAAKPRSRTVSEGKSLDTLIAEKDQRLAELKRRKQQNIRRRHTMVLRKISEQYENSQTIREDDLVFDQSENGFTTLEKLNEAEEEHSREKTAAATSGTPSQQQQKRRNPVSKKISKFIQWICAFRSST